VSLPIAHLSPAHRVEFPPARNPPARTEFFLVRHQELRHL
jgi:hypothetical protein